MLHENSLSASYTPDIATLIDGDGADLIERFADVASKWPGLPPTTRLAFEKAVVGIFIKAVEAGILVESTEAGEEAAYDLAAVAMFQVLDMVTAHEQPEFLKVCLGCAIGAEPRSQTEIAKAFGVERATVSKWARRFVEVLHLVPGRGMRRPAAVDAYRKRQHELWEGRKAA